MVAKILCGRTGMAKHYHDSVDDVRKCQSSSGKPTARMLNYVERLGGDRSRAAEMAFDECSSYIDNLRTGVTGRGGMTVLRAKAAGDASEHLKLPIVLIKDIPEGYYAIGRENGVTFDFWRVGVKKNEEGRITAWRLQSVPKRKYRGESIQLTEVLLIMAQGSTDWASIVVPMADKINTAMKRILVSGDAMKVQYGQMEGSCGICGRELTDEQSLSLGIGPECLKNNPHLLEE